MTEAEMNLLIATVTAAVQEYKIAAKWLLMHPDKRSGKAYYNKIRLRDGAKDFLLSEWCYMILSCASGGITGEWIIRELDKQIKHEIDQGINHYKSTWVHSRGKALTCASKTKS